MPKFNAQQLEILKCNHKNILVSASAGSGKTTILIARLLKCIIEDHQPIDTILAMTFSAAAANEIKKRLALGLHQALQDATTADQKKIINQALSQLGDAHISTIHAFCLSIIQKYYDQIQLPLRRIQESLDEGSAYQLQQTALQKTMEHFFQHEDPKNKATFQYFSNKPTNNEQFKRCILSLYELSQSSINPQHWIQNLTKLYQTTSFQTLPKTYHTSFFHYFTVEIQSMESILSYLESFIIGETPDILKKKQQLQHLKQTFPQLNHDLQAKDYPAFQTNALKMIQLPIPTHTDQIFQAERKHFHKLQTQLLSILFEEKTFFQDLHTLLPHVETLQKFVQYFTKCYEQLKINANKIDFNDMEHYALKILQANDHKIAKRYQKHFSLIMVDEFQDSNEVQDKLITYIAKENNVFRVGDMKQSIYGFRHALPQIMQNRIDQQGKNDRLFFLKTNYRSSQSIVEFNNLLYTNLMNFKSFSTHYSSNDHANIATNQQRESLQPIIFHALMHEDIKKNSHQNQSKNTIKATFIAQQIIQQKKQGSYKWSDFVVLIRSNTRKQILKTSFIAAGIPFFIDVKTGFYHSPSIHIMCSALACFLNPHDDIHFIALLTSPLFNYTSEDIANFTIQKQTKSYYTYVCSISDNPLLKVLKKGKAISCIEAIDLLYNTANYYQQHTSMQEKTNLDLFYETALNYQQISTNISNFLQHIQGSKDAKIGEGIPLSDQADVVRVMSIHQSKGLQFPICYLWSENKQNDQDAKVLFSSDLELGLSLKMVDSQLRYTKPSLASLCLQHNARQKALEEEMRILYVATTRAQQQLHFVDCFLHLEVLKSPLTPAHIYQKSSYSQWVLQTFYNLDFPHFQVREVHEISPAFITPSQQPKKPEPPLNYHQKQPSKQYSTPSSNHLLPTTFQWQNTQGNIYGQAMHTLLQYMDPSMTPTALLNLTKKLNISLNQSDINKITTLCAHPLYLKAHKGTVYKEYPYTIQKKDTIVSGIIDFLSINKQNIIIIDYKTDALKTLDDFQNRYAAQLQEYREAMHLRYPDQSIQCFIYSFHLAQMIPIN